MADRILLIDDDELMRESLELELQGCGYEVSCARDGWQAIEMAKTAVFDLVISDVRMPGISGLDTLTVLQGSQPQARQIVVTGYASADAPISALKMGVDDYLMKPFTTQDFQASVRRALARSKENRPSGSVQANLIRLVLGLQMETRYAHLAGHNLRVGSLAREVGRLLRFSAKRQENLYMAALLHDLGQSELGIELHAKPNLSPDEKIRLRGAPAIAKDILTPFEDLGVASTIILHLRERWDGSGVPKGLRGSQIPLESRILTLVEAYDSLTSDRPGRRALAPAQALARLSEESKRQFDPELVTLLGHLVNNSLARPNLEMNVSNPGAGLLQLAKSYLVAGRLELAASAYAEAAKYIDEDSPDNRFQLLYDQCRLYKNLGEFTTAVAYGEQALAHCQSEEMDWAAAQCQLRLADLKADAADAPERAARLESALATFKIWETRQEASAALLLLARIYDASQQPKRFAKTWLELLENLQPSSLTWLLQEFGDSTRQTLLKALEAPLTETATLRWLGSVPPNLLASLCGPIAEKSPMQRALAGLDSPAALKLLGPAAVEVSASAHLPPVSLKLLGPYQLLVGAEILDENSWLTRKIQGLFCYFAVHPGQCLDQERLTSTFWEGLDGDKATHSLHNSVSSIRKFFSPYYGEAAKTLVVKKRAGYQFNPPDNFSTDLQEFNQLFQKGSRQATAGNWEEALENLRGAERLMRGEFLAGNFDSWVDEFRTRCTRQVADCLLLVAGYFLTKGKLDVSAEHFRRLINSDNCNEDGYLGLMLTYVQKDKTHEAIKVYQECVKILKQELDISPSPHVTEAYLRIVQGLDLDNFLKRFKS